MAYATQYLAQYRRVFYTSYGMKDSLSASTLTVRMAAVCSAPTEFYESWRRGGGRNCPSI